MNKNTRSNVSRRQFLGQASCAAVGSTSLFSTLLNLAMTGRAAAAIPSSEYKALVCLFLAGGNDSFNMLAPLETDEYQAYKDLRGNLALDGSTPELTPLPISDTGGRAFGIHPSMPGIRDLYNSGDLAFVANTGTLITPTTLQMVNDQTNLPLGLYSHKDQIQHWQTALPQYRSGKGWGGRTADLLHTLNDSQQVSMNVSLSGSNFYQSGNTIVPYAITSNGSVQLDGYGGTSPQDIARTAAIDSMVDLEYANLFEKTYINKTKAAKDSAEFFQSSTDAISLSTIFPETSLGDDLKMVAKTIAAHSALGARRQTFFVQVGGWDHHADLMTKQPAMLAMVSEAVKAFRDALVEISMLQRVTLFQASDFGRTLTSNTKGTDHAWGGNYFVMGGDVQGGEVYGTYPNLADLSTIDTGRGRLIPATSVDEYSAEMARWFGVTGSDIDTVFPNIGNFPNGTNARPIGFLA